MHRVTKTYGHELGLSAAFRQWRAGSHCNMIHGYALAFSFVFESEELDERGWVIDFGNLRELKEGLQTVFDHKLLVAGDDPQLQCFVDMHDAKIADVLVFPSGVGCEAFAKRAYYMAKFVVAKLTGPRVRVVSCECREHGANSASYYGDQK